MHMRTRGFVWGGLVGLLLTAPVQAQLVFSDPHNTGRSGEVNGSGATLFEPFFGIPATTNDAIDVDGDGLFGRFDTFPFVDQLAADYNGGPGLTTFWAASYRSVGSINGLGEFIDWQLCGSFSGSVPPEKGYLNRFPWALGGIKQNGGGADCLDDDGMPLPDGTSNNDDGSPFCRSSVDFAALDVPGAWGVKGPAPDPNTYAANRYWGRNPTEIGYGENAFTSTNNPWQSQMQTLVRDCGLGPVSLNTNSPPDQQTIFDTQVAWGPIAYIANQGLARPDLDADGQEGDLRLTDAQHYLVTGRFRHGENIAGATRSSGSGTRNGIQNTSGVDPAWGDGDKLDAEWNVTANAHLGPDRRLTNAEGSSGVEEAVEVSRLGIGFTGLAGSGRAATDVRDGKYEVLNIMFDDRVPNPQSADYVRPTVTNVVDNGDPNTGYQLGGPVTVVTVGDPFEDDPNLPEYMESQSAAWYLRNIIISAQNFSDPNGVGDPNQFSMPGEYLAITYFLAPGIQALPSVIDPSHFVVQTRNEPLANYMKANNDLGSGVGLPDYGTRNRNGRVPRRKVLSGGATYADGQTSAYAYKTWPGGAFATIVGGSNRLAGRNRVQGDFNNDKLRNLNDIPKMMEAYVAPLDFETNIVGDPNDKGNQTQNVVIVHVIGDFDGTGNFDAEDVRYFADGLALDPASLALDPADPTADDYGLWLNRKAGFTAVDQNWATQPGGDDNFFNTVIRPVNPKTYIPGDSRGDVAGELPYVTRGADPRAADGFVDVKDIDYCYSMFKNQYLGFDNTAVDWANLDQAVYSDCSCDMTGPELVAGRRTILIDQKDIDELVEVILGMQYGDVDLDGDVDDADEATVTANQGQTGLGWAGGDLNGDNVVDAADLAFFGPSACLGDTNCDGAVNFSDIDPFVARLGCPSSNPGCNTGCAWQNADINGDGSVTFADIDPFVGTLGNTCR